MRKIALALVASLLVLGCASSASEWKVSLTENPSTGYTLDWKQEGEGRVEVVKDNYATSAPDRIGASGTHTYSFKGVKKGNVTLTFTDSRKWEKSGNKKEYVYKLLVDDKLAITELK